MDESVRYLQLSPDELGEMCNIPFPVPESAKRHIDILEGRFAISSHQDSEQ